MHSMKEKVEEKYDCKMCDLMFNTLVHLKAHTENDHIRKHSSKILNCNQCKSKFKLPADLRNHIQDIHQPKALKSILKNP